MTTYLVVLLMLACSPCPKVYAEADGSIDFKFMQLQKQLRETPDHPQARHWMFAIGEYYFREQSPVTAAEYFRRYDPQVSQGIEELLAAVYLLRCASSMKDPQTASTLTEDLREALSSRQFFAAFHTARTQDWQSPLGNRFELKESVDRLEIALNGKPFYTIDLN